MANEPIGRLPQCPFGLARTMEIRRKNGNGGNPLYLWSQETGPVFLNTRVGQDWILERAIMFDEAGNDPHAGGPDPAPADDPKPADDPPQDPPDEGQRESAGGFGFF